MTSQADLDASYTLCEEFKVADEATRAKAMVLLAEYDLDSDYETWCRIQIVNPDDPKVEAHYHLIHMLYLTLWNTLGDKEFFKRLDTAKRIVIAARLRRK
jgi:hypothetical protein